MFGSGSGSQKMKMALVALLAIVTVCVGMALSGLGDNAGSTKTWLIAGLVLGFGGSTAGYYDANGLESGVPGFDEVLQGAAQVAQPVGLAHEVGMQRDAHHQRLARRLLEHLVELVDDHVGELARVVLTLHDLADVVRCVMLGVVAHRNTRPSSSRRLSK